MKNLIIAVVVFSVLGIYSGPCWAGQVPSFQGDKPVTIEQSSPSIEPVQVKQDSRRNLQYDSKESSGGVSMWILKKVGVMQDRKYVSMRLQNDPRGSSIYCGNTSTSSIDIVATATMVGPNVYYCNSGYERYFGGLSDKDMNKLLSTFNNGMAQLDTAVDDLVGALENGSMSNCIFECHGLNCEVEVSVKGDGLYFTIRRENPGFDVEFRIDPDTQAYLDLKEADLTYVLQNCVTFE